MSTVKEKMAKRNSLKFKLLSVLITLIVVGELAIGIAGVTTLSVFGNRVVKNDLTNGFNAASNSLGDYFWGIEYRMETLGKTGIFQSDLESKDFSDSIKLLTGLKGANDVIMSTVFRSDDANISVPEVDYTSKGMNGVIPDDMYNKAKNGEAIWVGPYDDEISGKKALSVFVPVKTNNITVGVIGMNIDFTDISQFFSEKSFSTTGYSILLSSDGTILSDRKDMSKVHQKTTDTNILNIAKVSGDSEGSIELDGDTYYYQATDVSRTDWKMISLINENENSSVVKESVLMLIGILVVTVAICIFVVLFIINGIVKRLKELVTVMQKAGEGDLTSKVAFKDNGDEVAEIGNSYNKMLDDFSNAISDTKETMNAVMEKNTQLNKALEELKNSSTQISSTMEQIAAVSNEQARDTDTVVEETGDLATSIDNVSDSLKNMADSCAKLEGLTKVGLQTVNNLVESSNSTIQVTKEINNSINNVSQSSKEIEDIIILINDISDQTNLLALNAAIEAARVGENGKGFAVVADAIRKLAEQSQNATSNIQKIIETMQSKIQDTVNSIESVTEVIDTQSNHVKETENSFENIFDGVVTLNDEVKNADRLKNTMIEKKDNISNSMQNLAAGIEETSASTEEVSSYTEEQSAIANSVDDLYKGIVEENDILISKLNKFKQ